VGEGFTKGFVAISAPEPSEKVAAEDVEAFNQGVATGEQCAREAISLYEYREYRGHP